MPEADSSRERILLITRNLPPLRGGMERLAWHLARALAIRGDLEVVGPVGCAANMPDGARAKEIAYRPLARFLAEGARASVQASSSPRDLVFAGSGLAAPLAWIAARRAGGKLVVYLHGLDIVARSAIYQHCWLPFIRRADLVLANSANTRRLAIGRGIRPEAIEVLHPGVGAPLAGPDAGPKFREENALGDRQIFLAVGRLTPRKGLAEFIRHALPELRARDPGCILLVIGEDAVDSAVPSGSSECAQIIQAAKDSGLSDAVRILPHCDETTLSAVYQAANVHVFPVLDLPGDVEGFGMVAIEAAAHGLPTVAFAVGGIPDAVIEGATGTLVPPRDYRGMVKAIERWSAQDRQTSAPRCMSAANRFSWTRFDERLDELMSRLMATA